MESMSISSEQALEMNDALGFNYDVCSGAASDTYSQDAQGALAASVDYMSNSSDMSGCLPQLDIFDGV